LQITLTPAVVITAASMVTAIIVLFTNVFKIYNWYKKQNAQDKDIKSIKEEQCMICYALLSCLDGLKQLGANGNVTATHSKLEKHLNQSAHK